MVFASWTVAGNTTDPRTGTGDLNSTTYYHISEANYCDGANPAINDYAVFQFVEFPPEAVTVPVTFADVP